MHQTDVSGMNDPSCVDYSVAVTYTYDVFVVFLPHLPCSIHWSHQGLCIASSIVYNFHMEHTEDVVCSLEF